MTERKSSQSDGRNSGHYDAADCHEPLSLEKDAGWLSVLRNGEINEDWIQTANEVAVIGSRRLNGHNESNRWVTEARDFFFGQLMDWSNPESPFNGVFESMNDPDSRDRLVKPRTFIASQRVLSGVEGLDVARLLNDYKATVSFSSEHIQAKLDIFRGFGLDPAKILNRSARSIGNSNEVTTDRIQNLITQNLDPVKVIHTDPVVILRPVEVVNRRVEKIKRVAGVLGWEGSPEELVERFPQVLGLSKDKLAVHSRLFAEFGDTAWNSMSIANMLRNSLDVHLLALERTAVKKDEDGEVDEYAVPENYDYRILLRVTRAIPKSARPVETRRLLAADNLAELVGAKTLVAYRRYSKSRRSGT